MLRAADYVVEAEPIDRIIGVLETIQAE